jgi:RNA polymerase sigma-70 factor (ECF subfamily)
MSEKIVNIDDEDLFFRFRDTNDNQAFMLLYNKYSKKVFAYCLRACTDRDTAQDVFQKVYTSIVEKKHTFKGGCFIAWLMIITRNFVLMQKRANRHFDDVTTLDLPNETSSGLDFAYNELIHSEIEKLPEEFREIIKLRYFDDFSYNEIAEMLDISISLVKVRLYRAKSILSNALKSLKETL